MIRKPLWALLAFAIATAGTASASLAEVVYHRGNSADPETLDSHKTSTVYEAHISVDRFRARIS